MPRKYSDFYHSKSKPYVNHCFMQRLSQRAVWSCHEYEPIIGICRPFRRFDFSPRCITNSSFPQAQRERLRTGKQPARTPIQAHASAKTRELNAERELVASLGQAPNDGRPVIKWYNQLFPWSKIRWPSDPDNPDADDDTGEVKWLKQEVDRLKQELSEISGEGDRGKTLIEPLLEGLPLEHQRAAREEIKKAELVELRKANTLAQYLPTLEIKWALAPQQNAYLRHLNTYIQRAPTRMGDYTLRRRLWLSYARCKAFLPPFLHLIPVDTWAILFDCQTLASMSDDPHWATHVIILIKDMRAAEIDVDPRQKLLYIEALRFAGHSTEAIREWQQLGKAVEKGQRQATEYELLGVRLFTSQGDLGRAEEIASKYLETEGTSESRILIPIMDTWIQRKDEIGMKHAWVLYLRLRTQLGPDITMADYDNVSLSFLKGNRTDLALAVFKDMMLTGQQSKYDSLEVYRKSLGLIKEMHGKATAMTELNNISLAAMSLLPKTYQNKFFYGSWMKKLIGMDEADSAAAVLDLMYERGVTPSPKHLNGIIGAWLRTKSDSHKKKAEQLAWAMIYRRLDFVKARNKETSSDDHSPTIENDLLIPPHARRIVPCATIETYCILLLFYLRRGKWDSVQVLKNALEMGQMQPNSYWINHLLYSDLRQGHHEILWARYSNMFSDVVGPDLETFECLWECERAHLDPHNISRKHQQTCNFPNPRRIMCEMIAWFDTFESRDASRRSSSVAEDVRREFCDQIVRCTAQSADWPGTVVALYILKSRFGFYPDKKTTRSVGMQVARLMPAQQGSVNRQSRNYRDRIQQAKLLRQAKVDNVLQLVHYERARTLAEAGYDDFEELEDRIRREERLFVLAEFLRMIMRKSMPQGSDIGASIAKAASEMGVPGLDMSDPLPYIT